MKSIQKIIIVFLVTLVIILAAIFVFNGCTSTATVGATVKTTFQKILDSKSVKIGIITTAPPYDYLDASNKPAGYEVKFANELGKALVGEDGKVELVDLLGQNRIPALQTGQIDIGAYCMGMYPERAKLVMYSTHPYMVMGNVLLGNKDLIIKSYNDLVGKKVGNVKGTSSSIYLSEQGPKGILIQNFDDDILEVNALLAGQVEIITTADLLAVDIIKKNPDKNLAILYYMGLETEHVMLRQGDYDLKEFVDVFILSHYTHGDLASWWDETMPIPLGDLPTLATPMIPQGGGQQS